MPTDQSKIDFQLIRPWVIDYAVASYEKAIATGKYKGLAYDFEFLEVALKHLTSESEQYTLVIDCTDYANGIFYYQAGGARWKVRRASIELLYEWFSLHAELLYAWDVWEAKGKVVLIGGEKGAAEKLVNELHNYRAIGSRKNQIILHFSAFDRQLDKISLPNGLQSDEEKKLAKHFSNFKVRIRQLDIRKTYVISLNRFDLDTDKYLRWDAQRNLIADIRSLGWSVPYSEEDKVRDSILTEVSFTKITSRNVKSPVDKHFSK